jgi:hypothetical protein
MTFVPTDRVLSFVALAVIKPSAMEETVKREGEANGKSRSSGEST